MAAGPLAMVAGAVAYALLSHELMLHAAARAWAVLVLLGPLLAATGALAWRGRRWTLLGGVVAAIGLLAWLVARGAVATVDLLYVLQHAGVHLVLGIAFGLTLRQPRSMIGRVAGRVHPLTPAMVIYTRHLTLAWTVYFFGMCALSVLVYCTAPWWAWSLLANVLTPVAIALLFIGEHLLRYRLHPEFERVSLRDTVVAWRQRGLAPEVGEP